jgi:large subunit ribosomal protein L20
MRIKTGVISIKKRRKILKRASGFFGAAHRRYKVAKEQVMHAMRYEFVHRRQRRRDFRSLWISRINAAARMNGLTYSKLIAGLNNAGADVDRKILAKLAIEDIAAFAKYVELAKSNLKH